MAERAVEIVEVAPRDGLQSIAEPLPTGEKIAVVRGLIAAGLPRIEIGSFVSPRAVPQMADMAEIAEAVRGTKGTRLSVLVPNVRGGELALRHGLREIVYVFSVSETHNQNNVRQSVAQSLTGLADLVSAVVGEEGVRLRVDLATAFDCPFDGAVAPSDVAAAVDAVAELAPQAEIALCDTTGRATPFAVSGLFQQMMARPAARANSWAFHGHDTYGMGVANALAAWQSGVRVFDAAAAGLGGCPFAPGATGNTATEDLVYAFEGGSVSTGIDMKRLLNAADRIARLPGGVTGGHLRQVPRARVKT